MDSIPSSLGPGDSGRVFDGAQVSLAFVPDPASRIDIPDRAHPPAGIPAEALALAPDLPGLCAFPIPGSIPLPAPEAFGWALPKGPSQAEGCAFPVVSVQPEDGIRQFLYPAAFPDFPLQGADAGFIDCPKAPDAGDAILWPASAPFDAATLSREPDLVVHGFFLYEWADLVTHASASADAGGGTRLRLDSPPWYGYCDVNRCRIVNVFGALHPGRYYLDRARRLLFLAEPPAGVLSLAVDPAGPRVSLDGADNVTFRHCIFHDIRGVAVRARNCRNLVFEDCVFECVGGLALDIGGCEGFRLERCRLRDTSGGALRLRAGDRRSLAPGKAVVRHCLFERMGRLSSTYVPAVDLGGVGNAVERCEFSDMPSTAVRYDGNLHAISRNFFHDCVLVSDDQGAVETFGDPSARGTVISGNIFEDIGANGDHLKTGRSGVRFDDMICENIVEDNLFIRSSWQGFGAVQSHGGGGNVVRNNCLRDCTIPLSITPWTHERWTRELASERVQRLIHGDADIDSPAYREAWPSLATLADGPGDNIVEDNILLPR